MNPWLRLAFLIVFGAGLLVQDVAAQGSLNPPGAPGPTMRTLNQVEPRTPISTTPYVITRPGSYYLETNLTVGASTVGITISTSDVTLDLMGFVMEGATNSLFGIWVSGIRKNILIRNGTIRGFTVGVDAQGADNSQLSDLRVFKNRSTGLHIGQYARIENCLAMENGGVGLKTFQDSTILDCLSSSNSSYGIQTGTNSVVAQCQINENQDGGIWAAPRTAVENCQLMKNAGSAITLNRDSSVRGCTILYSVQKGILATNRNNVIMDNHVTGGNVGLSVSGGDNVVANNIVQNNVDNYDFAPSNVLDLVISEIPESIDWPARLRLLGDLYGSIGLTINADNVSIDLNGFSLIGRNSGSAGINVTVPCQNLSIKNGTLRDWVGEGLNASDADNGVLENVTAFNNGDQGLVVGDNWTVSHCTARQNGYDGFTVGDGCSLDHCTAMDNAHLGIYAGRGGVIHDCVARNNRGHGIVGGGHNYIHDCAASLNSSNGFQTTSMSVVQNNNASENNVDGFRIAGARSRIEGNHASLNTGVGFRSTASDVENIIVRNTSTGNGTAFSLHANSAYGEIINVSSPEIITNANPWANFQN